MLNDMERHQIAREIWLHIQLNHPSIIALYAAWKDRDYIYLVLEWAPEVCRACQHMPLLHQTPRCLNAWDPGSQSAGAAVHVRKHHVLSCADVVPAPWSCVVRRAMCSHSCSRAVGGCQRGWLSP
jgi:hypothetical protein